MRLADKVALITGAASGIGKETALLFALEGAKIVAVDLNDSDGEKIVSEVKSAGGDAIYVNADVSISTDCEKMINAAVEQYGKLNVLFNNAGIMDSRDDNARLQKRKSGI